jgi:acetyltransferase-like isoleucine patch superfamily enzyme
MFVVVAAGRENRGMTVTRTVARYLPVLGAIKRYLKNVALLARNDHLSIGRGSTVVQSRFGRHVRLGADVVMVNSSLGDFSYVGNGCAVQHTKLGKYCSVAPGALVGAGTHPSSVLVSTHPMFYLRRPDFGWDLIEADARQEFQTTNIGSDVWIGAHAAIRDGVRIGDGAIIGAGAVVVKDVEPFAVYVGVPATLLRYRFEPEEIAYLQELRWWDRDSAWIRSNAKRFLDVKDLRSG